MTSLEARGGSAAAPDAAAYQPDDVAIYQRIVEAAYEGIWVVDVDGKTTFANPKVSELLGYDAAEMATLSLFDIFDDAGRALAEARLARRRKGISDQEECEVIRKDGTRLFVRFAGSPLFDVDGTFCGVIGIMSDISERREIVDALRQREQQLAEAQQVAHLGSWEWDIASNVVTWSDEMYRSFGLQPQEFEATYEGYIQNLHPDDRDMVGAQVGAALEGGSFGFDHRILRANGEVIWIRARGEVVRDEHGTPVRMHGTGQDVTESKRSEVALREAAARYRLLQVMAVAANEASSIEEALHIAVDEICTHTGWAVGHAYVARDGELVALPISQMAEFTGFAPLLGAAAREGGTAVAVDVLRVGQPQIAIDLSSYDTSAAMELALESGMKSVLAFPVLVAGEVHAVLEFFTKSVSTAAPAAMETIAQVGTQLARVVERQRASDDLATARDEAMEASRLKSEFLATMSHEIRTPMNGVMGLTELLLTTDLDSRQRQYADGVQNAGNSLLGIINDVLDFSKIEAGRLELDAVDFDLLVTIDQATDLVAEAAREKGLELLTHCRADLPTRLHGDEARIRQVLINLAANAVKFTAKGEVLIRARLTGPRSTAGNEIMARFEVTDTGPGIAASDQQRLFEPFVQADASTTRRFGGTGLGLAISSQLVAAMGGEIGVDSIPGQGSTFWFTLPLQRQTGNESTVARHGSDHLKDLRVLVVDDNASSRMILREQLAAWGVAADSAPDGETALDQLREAARADHKYNLVIVDRQMPEMDGLDLAEQILSEPDLGSRIILLTSAGESRAEMSRAAAAIAFQLTKPVRLSMLHERLLQALAVLPDVHATHGKLLMTETVNARVLVVEDNSVNQLVARGMLANLGYGSDVAGNGIEALEALATTNYAAVLMDCHMPEMDGYAATGEIRRREGDDRHTPIIALTANAVAGDRQKCLDAGMDDYLAKPVSAAALSVTLIKWLETPSAAAVHG